MANEGDVDGGHRLGNFPNYYKFHPVEQRLKLFPPNLFVALFQALGSPRALFLLDVGCNEGDLSIALYHHVKRELGTSTTVRILGTDIDTTLVNRAVEKSKDIAADVSFIAMDYMEEQTSKYKLDEYLRLHGATYFDFISLFSITMWIHINHGAEGLNRFLRQSIDLTRACLLVEPQPRKCYKTARTRCRKQNLTPPTYLEQSFIEDTAKSESTNEIIKQMLMGTTRTMDCFDWGTEDWGRSLLLFRKIDALEGDVG